MCGICGLATSKLTPVDRELLRSMNDAMVHRGPDGEGYYFADGVGLAMRRLAVIDLVTGDQPIANETESIWIVFNGEVFNFHELRDRLQKMGHKLKTQTDTECLVHLYEEYGDDCVHHLRGHFAFALWDDEKKRLLIARDRLGQKPLYYTLVEGTLFFCSELSGLLDGLPRKPDIDLQAIDMYLSLQYIPEPQTPYKGIYKLPAGHRAIFSAGNLILERYWSLQFHPKWQAPEDDLMAELREKTREAVQIRMISDVPLGAHLSGGIDSSIVVALMAQSSSLPVKTFSVGFEEERFSELPYARAVADKYNTEHHEFTLTYGDIPTTLEHMIAHFGEPLADPSALPMYHLARETRKHVTVALNGDGGDDTFAGYQRYWLDPWANIYMRLPQWLTHNLIPKFVGLLPDRTGAPVGASILNGLKRLKQLPEVDKRASILRWGSYFTPMDRVELWKESYREHLVPGEPERLLVTLFEQMKAGSFLDRTMFADLNSYLPGDLLAKADRMTMVHSLEGRSPFLDHELASWAARLPDGMKVRGLRGKMLLRKAFANDLPPSVNRRGKQGFGIPIGAWFKGPMRGWAGEMLSEDSILSAWFKPERLMQIYNEHQAGKINHGKRIWALVVLGVWAKGNLSS